MKVRSKQNAVSSKRKSYRMFRAIVLCLQPTVLLLTVSLAEAQQPKGISRIGFLSRDLHPSDSRVSLSGGLEAFRQGLQELGYVDGKNIIIEYRYADGRFERLPALAEELVRLNVEIIVPDTSTSALAAKKVTTTIPIVMANGGNPFGSGLVASLARPSGNVTGLSNLNEGLGEKQLEILKEAFPKVSRVTVLWDSANPGNVLGLGEMKGRAEALRMRIQPMEVHGPNDIEIAFSDIRTDRASALSVLSNALTVTYRTQIVSLAAKSRLPAIYPESRFADAGGLMSYGANVFAQYRSVAVYVDKILKGAKPADLPVDQPKKFEFVINLKTAKALNLTIPQTVLFQADKVIK